MYPLVQRSLIVTLVVCAFTLTACGNSEATMRGSLTDNDPFVRVSRQGLTADGGPEGYASAGNENFYLAIHKSQLSERTGRFSEGCHCVRYAERNQRWLSCDL